MLVIVVLNLFIGVILLAAIDTLNSNVAQLKTDVEAYIASKQGAEAQIQAAADSVAALDAEVKAAQ